MFLFNCSVGAVHSIGAIGGPLSLSNVLYEVNACHNATLLACIGNHNNDKYHHDSCWTIDHICASTTLVYGYVYMYHASETE